MCQHQGTEALRQAALQANSCKTVLGPAGCNAHSPVWALVLKALPLLLPIPPYHHIFACRTNCNHSQYEPVAMQ